MKIVKALAFSLPLLLSLASARGGDCEFGICILLGPTFHNVPGGPVIVDIGGGAPVGDSGVGCTPCTVNGFAVSVLWPDTGVASVDGLEVGWVGHPKAGERTNHFGWGKVELLCGAEAVLEAWQGGGGGSQVVWECTNCQYD